jgi:hypothetical protein
MPDAREPCSVPPSADAARQTELPDLGTKPLGERLVSAAARVGDQPALEL